MKKYFYLFTFFSTILLLGTFCSTPETITDKTDNSTRQKANTESSTPEPPVEPAFITAIKEKIKGKEDLPAEEVFENIQILKGMPAKRVLPIMQMAFNQSLGVKCNHCHEFGKWASETKATKQITRDMWVMTGKINRELLPSIKNLKSEQPFVNCTTCHRGEAKPASSL